MVDLRGMNGERTLNADGEAHLADGEGLAAALAVTADDIALENLDTLAVTLGDAIVNLNVIANVELRAVK